MNEINDVLTVSFDIFENMDEPTAVVGRQKSDGFHLLNVITGDDAEDLYAMLLGEDKY